MATDFEISRSEGRCHACGRQLAAGEEFLSAVFEHTRREGFERRDFCTACWTAPPPDAYCHFRTRLPPKSEKRRLFVDDDVLINFFHRLGEHEDDPVKAGFRFVLTLILLRKRILRYEQTLRDGERESWQVRLVREQSVHQVLNPRLDEQRIQLLTGELGAILQGDLATADPASDRTFDPAGSADA